MALEIKEQITQQIKQAKHICIALPESPSVDAIVSALTLQHELVKNEKLVRVVSANFTPEKKLGFLYHINYIKPELGATKQSIIEVDVDKHPMEDIRYNVHDQKLRVLLTPKEGNLPEGSISLKNNASMYDLIITVNATELASLGNLFNDHKEFFFETPIINIDHKPDNEQFGQINWVNINATSTSEKIFDFFYANEKPSKDIATSLLAGIMDETHSLRTHQVNPQTLSIVSKLMEFGGDHELVVNNLYRTKTVGLLKLWGHVLDHLQSDASIHLAWSLIPASIFKTTGTGKEQVQDLMKEILNHSPEAKTIVLFLEDIHDHSKIEVQVSTTPPLHAKELIKDFQPIGGEHVATATLEETTLKFAEEEVIDILKKRISQVYKPR